MDYENMLKNIESSIRGDYEKIRNFESNSQFEKLFKNKYRESFQNKIETLLSDYKNVVNYIKVASYLEILIKNIENSKNKKAPYIMQQLVNKIAKENTIDVEINDYEESIDKIDAAIEELKKLGISDDYIKSLFPIEKSDKQNIEIPLKSETETYSRYIQKILHLQYSNSQLKYYDTLKFYIKHVPSNEIYLHNNLKTLAAFLRTHGVEITSNQLHDDIFGLLRGDFSERT